LIYYDVAYNIYNNMQFYSNTIKIHYFNLIINLSNYIQRLIKNTEEH